MPIFIPDLFSSYVEGRRKAIQDNWDDLTNYNEVLGGQLENAMSMETFDDAARMAHNASSISDLKRLDDSVNTALGLQKYQLGQTAGIPQKEVAARIAQLDRIIEQAQAEKTQLLTGAKAADMSNGAQPATTQTVQPKAQTDAATANTAVKNEAVKAQTGTAPGGGVSYNFGQQTK